MNLIISQSHKVVHVHRFQEAFLRNCSFSFLLFLLLRLHLHILNLNSLLNRIASSTCFIVASSILKLRHLFADIARAYCKNFSTNFLPFLLNDPINERLVLREHQSEELLISSGITVRKVSADLLFESISVNHLQFLLV